MTAQKRIFSGIQPSGLLTLGNYLGAIRQWTDLQHQYDCLFCIVDLHAITVAYNPQQLNIFIRQTAATYLAAGIDTGHNGIFVQSHVDVHAQLSWLLSCLVPMGWLNRMTQFKEKAGKHRELACLGLYAYPVLMAADILAYQTSHVPVGEDQKQHIELARDIAQSFNSRFDQNFFSLPQPLIQGPATRVMSLRDGTKKMSKSDESDYSRILICDDPEQIRQKIRKAKTDVYPLPGSMAELEGRPEAKNLLQIYAALNNADLQTTIDSFAGQDFAHFKSQLTDLVIATLTPINEQTQYYLKDSAELDRILACGAVKANTIGQNTLIEVKKIMGLL